MSAKRWFSWLLAAAAAPGLASADPAAWRVAGRSGGELVLLGSMHVLRASDHPLPASVDRLVDAADAVVMEMDLDDVDPAAQQRVILETAMLPQGTELADVIDADLYRSLEQGAAKSGLDLALLARFEPWFLAVTLQEVGLRKFGYLPERGLEQYVLARTRGTGKETLGLETLEFQLGIFDSLPAESQREMLVQTLAEIDEAEATLGAMTDAWRAGKLDELSEELLKDFEEFPGLYETLVTQRNNAWVGSLEKLLADGRRYLVVVGALHLVGRDNVIELLRARNHVVDRIN
jgi:uncharacterized protein YbaP (TraB family)